MNNAYLLVFMIKKVSVTGKQNIFESVLPLYVFYDGGHNGWFLAIAYLALSAMCNVISLYSQPRVN